VTGCAAERRQRPTSVHPNFDTLQPFCQDAICLDSLILPQTKPAPLCIDGKALTILCGVLRGLFPFHYK
jgi:hypothetical protein